jgi:alpha-N-acetylglucosamine transferase
VTAGLQAYGVKIVHHGMPFAESDLDPRHAQFLQKNPNCCGWREFYKFAAWRLVQYKRVILMDSDLQIVGGVDHLLRCGTHTFLATPGFYSPLNGGLWVLTPSACTYQDMVRLVLQV